MTTMTTVKVMMKVLMMITTTVVKKTTGGWWLLCLLMCNGMWLRCTASDDGLFTQTVLGGTDIPKLECRATGDIFSISVQKREDVTVLAILSNNQKQCLVYSEFAACDFDRLSVSVLLTDMGPGETADFTCVVARQGSNDVQKTLYNLSVTIPAPTMTPSTSMPPETQSSEGHGSPDASNASTAQDKECVPNIITYVILAALVVVMVICCVLLGMKFFSQKQGKQKSEVDPDTVSYDFCRSGITDRSL